MLISEEMYAIVIVQKKSVVFLEWDDILLYCSPNTEKRAAEKKKNKKKKRTRTSGCGFGGIGIGISHGMNILICNIFIIIQTEYKTLSFIIP